MGRVYRAERIDGSFERQVALKLSTVSSVNDALAERFRREQAVLAGLNHPNIAQLFDAGVTEEGWPYIVMELVDGQQIDVFCRAEELGLGAMVRLFIQIVDAVALAHSRLIVHRDIKPTNILVDDYGRPKLLDFGIAKTLEEEIPIATAATPLTPRYASPEQLLDAPITASSDVFQLGLLLHLILTGTDLLSHLSRESAIRHAVSQKPIELPESTRGSLPRDLFSVIETCLHMAPADRYRDAAALGDDLRAFLDGFPLAAAGNNTWYRLRKFVGRHRIATGISLAALLILVGGSGWYTWRLAEARDLALAARGESEAVLEFVVAMLGSANPNEFGEEFRVAEALDAAAAQLDHDVAMTPKVRARIHDVIGDTFRSLGREDAAEIQHRARLLVYDQLGSEAATERVDTLIDLAWLQREKGLYDESFVLGQQAIDTAREAYGDKSKLLASAKAAQANTYIMFGTVDKAIPLLESATEIYSAIDAPDMATQRAELAATARLLSLRERYAEAVATYRRLYDLDVSLHGEGHTESLITLGNMSSSMLLGGMLEQAAEGRRKQLGIMRRVLGETHPYTLITMITLATTLQSTPENFAEQESLIKSAIAGYESHGQPDHSRLVTARYTLGSLYRLAGDYENAVIVHRDNMSRMKATFGERAPLTLFSIGDLASAQCRLGRTEAALDNFLAFQRFAPEVLGEKHRMTILYTDEHAACLRARDTR